jgi:hypothetical protein
VSSHPLNTKIIGNTATSLQHQELILRRCSDSGLPTDVAMLEDVFEEEVWGEVFGVIRLIFFAFRWHRN